MIIMDIKVDNMYAFQNFHMNMSYPKKIVDSTIENEYLEERPNFRYKKVNIIMGGNATGKTTLGKLLMSFANYFVDGNYARFTNVIDDSAKEASLIIDFVAEENALYRFNMVISPKQEERYVDSNVSVRICCTPIGMKDSYETCARRLDECLCGEVPYNTIDTEGWYFTYPQDAWNNKTYCVVEEEEKYIYILEQTLKTLDPSIEKVIKINEFENA